MEQIHSIVSVIIPVHNGAEYLEECLTSIKEQAMGTSHSNINDQSQIQIQLSVYDDASTDSTYEILRKWEKTFQHFSTSTNENFAESRFSFSMICGRNDSGCPRGVGFAKNRAIEQSTGDFLCFCDADDVMFPSRISEQYKLASQHRDAIIGSQFIRLPENSTHIYTHWANKMRSEELYTQIYTSFGPTVLMPTWFCHRSVFLKVPGGFSEIESGNPEDLILFYQHLELGGRLLRVDLPLLKYRYHQSSLTFSISATKIREIRMAQFEKNVLANWSSFTIWNAGKLGRRFFRSLQLEIQDKVLGFCDIDPMKVAMGFYHPYPLEKRIPIRYIQDATPPFVICVKTELVFDDNGTFQRILKSLQLVEGLDYFFFN